LGNQTFIMSSSTIERPVGAGLARWGRADADTVAEFRNAVDAWIDETITVTPERRSDILLATDEALSNCADHAYREHGDLGTMAIEVTHRREDSTVVVCVRDYGAWTTPESRTAAALRGRGIVLMNALADDVSIDGRGDGTTVSLRFSACRAKPRRLRGVA
jgi:anti-sigma regulatory factor (Ser/Thr protein kinase)